MVERILDERGLTFFLRGAGSLPFALDDRRIDIAVEMAARQLAHEPLAAARESCFRHVRRHLITLVAEAMVKVGF